MIGFGLGNFAVMALNAFIVFLAIVLSDRFLNHNMSIKRSAIMTIIAYFAMPYLIDIATSYISLPWASIILVPLVVWIILGEILLTDFTFKEKFKVALVAFVTYLILEFVPVGAFIVNLLSQI